MGFSPVSKFPQESLASQILGQNMRVVVDNESLVKDQYREDLPIHELADDQSSYKGNLNKPLISRNTRTHRAATAKGYGKSTRINTTGRA